MTGKKGTKDETYPSFSVQKKGMWSNIKLQAVWESQLLKVFWQTRIVSEAQGLVETSHRVLAVHLL